MPFFQLKPRLPLFCPSTKSWKWLSIKGATQSLSSSPRVGPSHPLPLASSSAPFCQSSNLKPWAQHEQSALLLSPDLREPPPTPHLCSTFSSLTSRKMTKTILSGHSGVPASAVPLSHCSATFFPNSLASLTMDDPRETENELCWGHESLFLSLNWLLKYFIVLSARVG